MQTPSNSEFVVENTISIDKIKREKKTVQISYFYVLYATQVLAAIAQICFFSIYLCFHLYHTTCFKNNKLEFLKSMPAI